MSPDFEDVYAFHVKFDLPRAPSVPFAPMPPEHLAFRLKFLREELGETFAAWRKSDLVGFADGLLDFVYVVYGTANFLGAPRAYVDEQLGWPTFEYVTARTEPFGLTLNAETPRLPDAADAAHYEKRMSDLIDGFHWLSSRPRLAARELWRAAAWTYELAGLCGIPWVKCWRHVQAANMSKVRASADGSDSKRLSAFDVIKPPGFVRPDAAIRLELTRAGAEL